MEANEEGQIMIPFSAQSEENVPIILVHGSFAELSYINLIKEEYEFRCTYLYNEESFLRGNKAKIIIQPRLFIQGVPINMKIIEEPLITVVYVNENDIPTTFNFAIGKNFNNNNN